MKLEFGVCLTNYGGVTSVEASIGTAKLAEDLGYASVWVSDHILVPPEFEATYGPQFLDPFVCLTYAAAETRTVKLGTTVIIVPLRSPFAQAKMLSTLDYLSGGRVIFGVGAGWDEEEFDALGVPYRERGRLTDEYLDIMRELWMSDAPTFRGRYHSFSAAAFEPKPIQRPIPIWVGGYSRAAVRRAVRVGQAWHPSEMAPSKLEKLHALLQHGAPNHPALTYRMYLRPTEIHPAPLTTSQSSFEGDRQAIIEHIEEYTMRFPIEHLVFEFVVAHATDLKDCFRYLAEEVLPGVRGFDRLRA